MAELDTLWVYNPLKDDFKWKYNGEYYSISAEAGKNFPQGLAFHMAKHLSDAMLAPGWEKLQKQKTSGEENQAVNQAVIYDTPQRRIALYNILGSKNLVEECIKNFNFKGFIGEISVYDDYVAKLQKKEEKVEETPKVEKPTRKGAAKQVAGVPAE